MEFVHGVCTGVHRFASGCRLSWAPRSKALGFELLQLGQPPDIGVPSYTPIFVPVPYQDTCQKGPLISGKPPSRFPGCA